MAVLISMISSIIPLDKALYTFSNNNYIYYYVIEICFGNKNISYYVRKLCTRCVSTLSISHYHGY